MGSTGAASTGSRTGFARARRRLRTRRPGAALKAERPELRHGIEYVPEVAAVAADRLDDVVTADLDALEKTPAGWQPFDAVTCGDVLEHLRDPTRVLEFSGRALPRTAC